MAMVRPLNSRSASQAKPMRRGWGQQRRHLVFACTIICITGLFIFEFSRFFPQVPWVHGLSEFVSRNTNRSPLTRIPSLTPAFNGTSSTSQDDSPLNKSSRPEQEPLDSSPQELFTNKSTGKPTTPQNKRTNAVELCKTLPGLQQSDDLSRFFVEECVVEQSLHQTSPDEVLAVLVSLKDTLSRSVRTRYVLAQLRRTNPSIQIAWLIPRKDMRNGIITAISRCYAVKLVAIEDHERNNSLLTAYRKFINTAITGIPQEKESTMSSSSHATHKRDDEWSSHIVAAQGDDENTHMEELIFASTFAKSHAQTSSSTEFPLYYLSDETMVYMDMRTYSHTLSQCGARLACGQVSHNEMDTSLLYSTGIGPLQDMLEFLVGKMQEIHRTKSTPRSNLSPERDAMRLDHASDDVLEMLRDEEIHDEPRETDHEPLEIVHEPREIEQIVHEPQLDAFISANRIEVDALMQMYRTKYDTALSILPSTWHLRRTTDSGIATHAATQQQQQQKQDSAAGPISQDTTTQPDDNIFDIFSESESNQDSKGKGGFHGSATQCIFAATHAVLDLKAMPRSTVRSSSSAKTSATDTATTTGDDAASGTATHSGNEDATDSATTTGDDAASGTATHSGNEDATDSATEGGDAGQISHQTTPEVSWCMHAGSCTMPYLVHTTKNIPPELQQTLQHDKTSAQQHTQHSSSKNTPEEGEKIIKIRIAALRGDQNTRIEPLQSSCATGQISRASDMFEERFLSSLQRSYTAQTDMYGPDNAVEFMPRDHEIDDNAHTVKYENTHNVAAPRSSSNNAVKFMSRDHETSSNAHTYERSHTVAAPERFSSNNAFKFMPRDHEIGDNAHTYDHTHTVAAPARFSSKWKIHKENRRPAYPFITGDGFRAMCPFHCADYAEVVAETVAEETVAAETVAATHKTEGNSMHSYHNSTGSPQPEKHGVYCDIDHRRLVDGDCIFIEMLNHSDGRTSEAFLRSFFTHVLPRIDKRVVIVTHNGDMSAPGVCVCVCVLFLFF
jgi:hypothetical protein